jgi:serine/arginine repetitive matrix protein 2
LLPRAPSSSGFPSQLVARRWTMRSVETRGPPGPRPRRPPALRSVAPPLFRGCGHSPGRGRPRRTSPRSRGRTRSRSPLLPCPRRSPPLRPRLPSGGSRRQRPRPRRPPSRARPRRRIARRDSLSPPRMPPRLESEAAGHTRRIDDEEPLRGAEASPPDNRPADSDRGARHLGRVAARGPCQARDRRQSGTPGHFWPGRPL